MIFKKIFLLGLLFVFVSGTGSVSAAISPTAQVQKSVDKIMEILNNKSIATEERNQKLEELIRNRFDFQIMSQWILGINWRKATPQQREKFINLFTELLEANYKGRISEYADQYTDEKVEYGTEQIKGEHAMVNTFVVTKDKKIPISYKLVQENGEWKVYDIVIEEVSLVRNYRSTYDEIIRKEGFEGLFTRMEQKIQELRKSPEGSPEAKTEALPPVSKGSEK